MPKPNKKKRNYNSSVDSIENISFQSEDDLNMKVAKIYDNTEQLLRDFQVMKNNMEKLQVENDKLKNENFELKQQLNDLDQYGRRMNLRFLGIEEETNENCEAKIADLIKNKLKIKNDIFIDVAHRVGRKGNERPRPIIVRFGFRRHAAKVLKNRR